MDTSAVDETANLLLPYIMPAQAQKHITHNEALARLDALVQLGVIDRDDATPPGSPSEGDRYIVAAGATGAWDGWDDSVAAFAAGAWVRFEPKPGWLCWVEDEALLVFWTGSGWQEVHAASHAICEGRPTLESGVPVSTADQLAKTMLYFTPSNGNRIGLYDGAGWNVRGFAEVSISLSGLTANAQYDLFGYDNAGTLALELLQWTGTGNVRATTLAVLDGVLVKSGAPTRRYLGTIGITGTTGQCEDSVAKRLVWSRHSQAERILAAAYAGGGGGNHEYHAATLRQFDSDAAMQVEFVRGLATEPVTVRGFCGHITTANATLEYVGLGLGLDRTDGNDATQFGRISIDATHPMPGACFYDGTPGIGRHSIALLEKGAGGASNNNWYGSDATDVQTGLAGTMRG